jgi:hypothetical protein
MWTAKAWLTAGGSPSLPAGGMGGVTKLSRSGWGGDRGEALIGPARRIPFDEGPAPWRGGGAGVGGLEDHATDPDQSIHRLAGSPWAAGSGPG